MHPAQIPDYIVERLMTRRGRLHAFEAIDPRRTALVVIDMQEAFLAPGAPSETPVAREIVPNINRLAAALRAAGGAVAWVQAAFKPAGPQSWRLYFDCMVAPALSAAILDALTEGQPGHALWRELDAQPGDIRVKKIRYSAFFPGACELPQLLRARAIDCVLVAGTLTNVCCEASVRDAMMDGFKAVLVSDANAARSDAEHVASMASVIQFFGDVRGTDELIAMLRAAAPA